MFLLIREMVSRSSWTISTWSDWSAWSWRTEYVATDKRVDAASLSNGCRILVIASRTQLSIRVSEKLSAIAWRTTRYLQVLLPSSLPSVRCLFQVIRHKIAVMAIEVESIHTMLEYVCFQMQQKSSFNVGGAKSERIRLELNCLLLKYFYNFSFFCAFFCTFFLLSPSGSHF